jgi:hypothetical protein
MARRVAGPGVGFMASCLSLGARQVIREPPPPPTPPTPKPPVPPASPPSRQVFFFMPELLFTHALFRAFLKPTVLIPVLTPLPHPHHALEKASWPRTSGRKSRRSEPARSPPPGPAPRRLKDRLMNRSPTPRRALACDPWAPVAASAPGERTPPPPLRSGLSRERECHAHSPPPPRPPLARPHPKENKFFSSRPIAFFDY